MNDGKIAIPILLLAAIIAGNTHSFSFMATQTSGKPELPVVKKAVENTNAVYYHLFAVDK